MCPVQMHSTGFGHPQGERRSWVCSSRRLSGWAEMEPSKLGQSPSASSNSVAATGPSGLSVGSVHKEDPRGCIASKEDGVSGDPKISQSVGPRKTWGGVLHLPFLLRRELRPTLIPSVTHPSHCSEVFQPIISALGLRTDGVCLSSTLVESQPP